MYSPCPFYTTSFFCNVTNSIYRKVQENLPVWPSRTHNFSSASVTPIQTRTHSYWYRIESCNSTGTTGFQLHSCFFIQTPYYFHVFLMARFSTACCQGSFLAYCQKHTALTYLLCNSLLLPEVPRYLIHGWDQTSPLQINSLACTKGWGEDQEAVKLCLFMQILFGESSATAQLPPPSSASATWFVVTLSVTNNSVPSANLQKPHIKPGSCS